MNDYNDFDEFEARVTERQEWKAKMLRFARYLSTRKMECWGFFIAGYLIATIF